MCCLLVILVLLTWSLIDLDSPPCFNLTYDNSGMREVVLLYVRPMSSEIREQSSVREYVEL